MVNGHSHSIRVKLPLVDAVNWGYLLSAMVYGDAWRAGRKLFQKHFNPAKPEVHQPLALRSTRERFLPQLLESPDSWEEICKQ